MPNPIKDIPTQTTELAMQAAALLKDMMDAADRKDKKVAFAAYRDVLRLIGRVTINEFDGRTALLTGLVAELMEVTRSIRVQNPVTAHLNKLADVTEKALDFLKADKTTETETA